MKKMYRLNLDHNRIFWGGNEVSEEDAREGDVLLDHCPDNPPGRYRWDGAALVALPASQVKIAPEAPSLEQAFHAIVASLEAAGHALPPAARAWCDDFKKTLDAQ
jgi:hypothetical protein